MTRTWQLRQLIYVFLICFLAWSTNALEDRTSQTPLSRKADSWEQDPGKVASDVSQAWTELRALSNTNGRFWKLNKKSGVVGKTVYYAKKGFVLLFMNSPQQSQAASTMSSSTQLSKPLTKAIRVLERGADLGNQDAIFLLAEMNFYGNFTHPRNYTEAFKRYKQLASTYGNASAQYMTAFFYATGLGDAVERDQSKSLLYHTFAASAGDVRSEMTLAYRYHAGIGTPKDCDEASIYYKKAADKAIEWTRSGPPGGVALSREARRVADELGGVYGEGASFSTAGQNSVKSSPNSDVHASFDDYMDYLDVLSRKGEIKATYNLARNYYDGSRAMKKSYRDARQNFLAVARKYWSYNDKVISEDPIGTGKLAAKAAAYLGRMYLRGEGVEQNFAKAIRWFKLGMSNGDAFSQYEMGLVYLHGYGVQKDAMIAAEYFKAAAKQDWPAAQVQLGKLFLDQGDVLAAETQFEYAARHGHVEAIYHLAEFNNHGVGHARSCGLATAYYKLVVEKAEPLHSSFEEANTAYEDGDLETALVAYMMAAEQGYEQAQANVAFLLDEQKSILPLDSLIPWSSKRSPILQNAVLALIYWTRSARQGNIDSTVKMGDYYLNGFGVQKDVDNAAACYTAATEMQQSALAAWNLGWLYENGIGVEQDYHLASRYYYQALDTNHEAYLPVMLSMWRLRLRNWWNKITGGNINPINPEPELIEKPTWSQWFSKFINDEHATHRRADMEEDIDPRMHEPMPAGDDYYPDEFDESAIESLVIVVLAGALALLVYYRQQRQQAHRRLEDEQRRRQEFNAAADGVPNEEEQGDNLVPGQQADGGFFPPPDDPNFDAWRMGGIGL